MKARFAIALLGAAVLLTACGVKGPLVRPPPMFGDARDQYLAEQARLKAEADARAAAGQPAPETPRPPAPDQPAPSSPIAPTIPR